MTFPFYFHHDLTVFQWSKEFDCIDRAGQGDGLGNAESLGMDQEDTLQGPVRRRNTWAFNK